MGLQCVNNNLGGWKQDSYSLNENWEGKPTLLMLTCRPNKCLLKDKWPGLSQNLSKSQLRSPSNGLMRPASDPSDLSDQSEPSDPSEPKPYVHQ